MGNEASKIKGPEGLKPRRAKSHQSLGVERTLSRRPSLPSTARIQSFTSGAAPKDIDFRKPETQHPQVEDETSRLRRRIKELEEQVAIDEERKAHTAKVQAQWEKQIQETQAQQRLVEQRTQERDEAHAMLSQLDVEVKKMEAQFKKLEDRRKEVDAETAAERKRMAGEAAAKDKELGDARAQQTRREEDAAAKDKELADLRAELQRISEKILLLEQEKSKLMEELEAAKEKMDGAAESVEHESQKFQAELKEAEEKVQTLEKRNAELEEELSHTKEKASGAVEAAKADAAAEIGSATAQLDAANKKAEQLATQVDALKEELASAKADAAEVDTLKKELATAKAEAEKVNTLEEELATAKAEAAEQVAKANAASQLADARAPPSPATTDRDSSEVNGTSDAASSAEIAALTEELEAMKVSLATAESKVQMLEASKGQENATNESMRPVLAKASSYKTMFTEPVRFSNTAVEDLRVGVDKRGGEVKVDIREWGGSVRSRRVSVNHHLPNSL
jgi:chromosome segregation ATPase